ncbi:MULTISPECIES: glycosyltransferase [unclassified Sphingomonas]|jgi:glycosyltransferase involved in cell wall biosynthesis|uniref:glycosyltransferase family 2 protein n=4 Tax=Pseudomonadota TaxID=1224 RepID=UPI000A98779D|nr:MULTISPECIES: glycosyltransferase [unclassified Sphingomonas]
MSIALVCLSCRRPRHFMRAVESVMLNCLDLARVRRFVVIDDGSPDADVAAMQARWPQFELIRKPAHLKGQGTSLMTMLEAVDEDLILYWEDDTILIEQGHWISRATAVVEAGFSQVIFDTAIVHEPCLRAIAVSRDMGHFALDHDTGRDYAPAATFRYNIDPWPGAVVRPGLWHAATLRARGIRFHPSDFTNMEYRFSLDFGAAGLTSAVLAHCRVFDLGYDVSAHVLNETRRAHDPVGPSAGEQP